MFCVVRQYKMKSTGDIDKVTDAARNGFVPIVSKAPGFIGYSIALSDDGQFITTGFFENRAGADESTKLAADWVRDNVLWAVEGSPKITSGEVRIQERHDGDVSAGGLRRIKLQPGKLDEALDLMRKKLLPLLMSVDGFVSVAVLESGTDELTSLAAWRNRASLEKATSLAMPFMQENAGHLMAGPPEIINADIKFRHINEAAFV